MLLPDDVVTVLARDARAERVELTGSRAGRAATALSGWDFTVTAAEFETVRDALPSLTAPLRPVVGQWHRPGEDRPHLRPLAYGRAAVAGECLDGPLGVAAVPGSLAQAVAGDRTARGDRETAFRCRVA